MPSLRPVVSSSVVPLVRCQSWLSLIRINPATALLQQFEGVGSFFGHTELMPGLGRDPLRVPQSMFPTASLARFYWVSRIIIAQFWRELNAVLGPSKRKPRHGWDPLNKRIRPRLLQYPPIGRTNKALLVAGRSPGVSFIVLVSMKMREPNPRGSGSRCLCLDCRCGDYSCSCRAGKYAGRTHCLFSHCCCALVNVKKTSE